MFPRKEVAFRNYCHFGPGVREFCQEANRNNLIYYSEIQERVVQLAIGRILALHLPCRAGVL